MGPSIQVILKDKDRDKPLDGSGVALEVTIPDLTIRTGVDQKIVHHLDLIFLLKMIMPWICLPLSVKPQTTRNVRNTERLADALNMESKATLFAIVPIKRHALVQLTLFKSKRTTNRSSPKLLPHLHLLLCE